MLKILTVLSAVLGIAICLLCPSTAFAWDGNDNIMMWMLSDTGNTVDDGPDVYTYLGVAHANDDIGVRIAAYDNSGNLVKYLNPVYGGAEGESGFIDWDYNDEYIGTRDDLPAEIRQAYYGPSDYAEMLFQMQVGNYDGNDNFIPLLYSLGGIVDGKYWYDSGSMYPQYGEWTPTKFYTINPVVPIPEPTTFLLLLLGFGILALRRKNGNC